MSASPPLITPRKSAGVRVMPSKGHPLNSTVPYPGPKANGVGPDQRTISLAQARREVDILNHCFEDVERFMGQLQQTANAQTVLIQRKSQKKKSQKTKNKRKKEQEQEDDKLNRKASPPKEEEFVDIFQKIKHSLNLLGHLRPSIIDPEDLLHRVFIPLDLLVKTTRGPKLAANVVSPGMSSSAISLLQEQLSDQEKDLWNSLGPNWTSQSSQLHERASPYVPIFLDGWQPEPLGPEEKPFQDSIENQHIPNDLRENTENSSGLKAERPDVSSEHEMGYKALSPEDERMFCCSYDFVARNSSELSVLQGETLEVLESSERWWKCRNSYGEVGLVPFNILEPQSAVDLAEANNPVQRRGSQLKVSSPTSNKFLPGAAPSAYSYSSKAQRPESGVFSSLPEQNGDKAMMVKDELLHRLTNGSGGSTQRLSFPRTSETSAPLTYHSPPAEVEDWLRGKGFSEITCTSLGILNGAQLFSLKKDELRSVSPEEGARVYSQIKVQQAQLEDDRKATELEKVMEKQKMKVDQTVEGGQL